MHYLSDLLFQKPKIKHSTLRNGYESGGLEDVDIFYLQCFWISRLFHDNFYDWEVIPLVLIKRRIRKKFKFYNTVGITKCSLKICPHSTRKFLFGGVNIFLFLLAYLQQLSLNIYGSIKIKVDGKCISFRDFSQKGLNFVRELFGLKRKLKK